jgi:hypothetical protein
LFSSLITLIVTAIQLYRDYNRDLLLIDSQLKQIQDVPIRIIAGSLWLLDAKGMQVLVDGILQLPDILYLEVSDGDRVWASAGVKPTKKMISRKYALTYQHLGPEQRIGSMVAVATLERVYQRLIDKTVDILISNAILTFLVAGFMLLVFYYLVTRHLIDIASFIRGQSLEQEGEPLRLDRKLRNKNKSDELELVVDELNLMRDSLQQTFSTLRASIWQSLFTETGLTGLFCLTRKHQVGIGSGKLRQSIEIKWGQYQPVTRDLTARSGRESR